MAELMAKITGSEPRHWHTDRGVHRMPDMRKFPGYPVHFWDSDERAYVTHLEAHESAQDNPVPEPGDSEQIRNLFQLISVSGKAVRNARLMIIALRQAEAHTAKESAS